MKRPTTVLVVLALALAATACADTSADTADPPTTAAAPDAAAAFPTTFTHRHGETELTERPERIVTVGLTDHDAFLALGVVPVGTTEWYGEHPGAVWPWAQDALGDAEPPTIVGTAAELDFEQVAALAPDVIVGLYSAIDEQTYATLSEIAPTIAQPDEHVDYGVPWQELTVTAGRVVGMEAAAEELVVGVEDQFAQAQAEHPVFVGASYAAATPFEGIYAYNDDVALGRIFTSLGFELPTELDEMIGDGDGAAISPERVELLDTDVLLWLDGQPGEGPAGEELYQSLDVHQEGREFFISSASGLGSAMAFSSVLSLPAAIDGLVPMLAAAIDGDPATEVPEAA